jgi:hypothetical protein
LYNYCNLIINHHSTLTGNQLSSLFPSTRFHRVGKHLASISNHLSGCSLDSLEELARRSTVCLLFNFQSQHAQRVTNARSDSICPTMISYQGICLAISTEKGFIFQYCPREIHS